MKVEDQAVTIALASEKLQVDRRLRTTGVVRVKTFVEVDDVQVDETVAREVVLVEHRTLGTLIATVPAVREEGDLIIVPVVEEELVVEKRLRLKEEIVLRRVNSTERHRESVQLRRTRAVIEREPVTSPSSPIMSNRSTTMHTLTAMFDTTAQAEAAAARLADLGIDPDSRNVIHQEVSSEEATRGNGEGGFLGSLKKMFSSSDDRDIYAEGIRRGGAVLTVTVGDEQFDAACDSLESSGAVDIDSRSEEWKASGWSAGTSRDADGDGMATAAGMAAPAATSGSAGYSDTDRSHLSAVDQRLDNRSTVDDGVTGSRAAPLATSGDRDTVVEAEEELAVGKRETRRGGVRIRTHVTERPVEEQVTLRRENISVDRRPVNRELSAGDDAFSERTIEAEERAEEAVVSKQARVTEEISLRKDVDHETETVRDTVRDQDVEVIDDRQVGTTGVDRVADVTDTSVTTERGSVLNEEDELATRRRAGS